MMFLMVGTVVWSIYFDTMQPNPGLTRTSSRGILRHTRSNIAERKT